MDADFLLIRKMKLGDDGAFDSFVHKYYGGILTYCNYHCPDPKYAEDITQETFVRFFTKLPVYHYRGKTQNYLYTIAGNLCKDYLRKIKETPVEETRLHEKLETTEDQTEDVLNKLTVERALKRLPRELNEVITLYYFEEFKLAEIAHILQIGLPLAKYRLRRAKTQLKNLLQKEGEYESEKTTRAL